MLTRRDEPEVAGDIAGGFGRSQTSDAQLLLAIKLAGMNGAIVHGILLGNKKARHEAGLGG